MITELERLWNEVENCDDCKKTGNTLRHILGGGQEHEPDVMFIFINPTYRNTASRETYVGPRFPFIGTKEIWRVFVDASLLEGNILGRIDKGWTPELVDTISSMLRDSRFYLTNLVKCTQPDSRLPNKRTVHRKIHLLYKEISIVKPRVIVAFGSIPLTTLSNVKIKLKEHYEKQILSKDLITYPSLSILGDVYRIFPSYFPVGRGDRKRAIELLKILKNSYLKSLG